MLILRLTLSKYFIGLLASCWYIYRWILSSPVIETINLDGNLIGDGGGREVAQAMRERKEGMHQKGKREGSKPHLCSSDETV